MDVVIIQFVGSIWADLKPSLAGQPSSLQMRVWRCMTLAFQLCDPKPTPPSLLQQQQQQPGASARAKQTLQRPGQKPATTRPAGTASNADADNDVLAIDSQGSDGSDEDEGNSSPSPHPLSSAGSRDAAQGRVAAADWLGAMLFLARAPFAQKLTLAFSLADLDVQDSLTPAQLVNMVRACVPHYGCNSGLAVKMLVFDFLFV